MPGTLALEGIKVASFAWMVVGPLTVRYLALHGATVVRVESHRRPDMVRLMAPFKGNFGDPNHEPYFANLNCSTLGLSIDISRPTGLTIAWKLISWADVVTENFMPGMMKKWGLDYANVAKVRPDIVYASTTSMGQTGPSAQFIGYGYQAMARAGFTHVSGWPDRDPAPPQMAYTDFSSPRFNVSAILAALDHRRRTGRGQYIDSSQSECSMHLLAPMLMDYAANGRVQCRDGNRLPYAAPHGVFPCAGEDRWCAIAVFSDEKWRRFCEVIGRPGLIEDERFGTLIARKRNEDDLNNVIGEWTSARSSQEVERLMQEAGIAASVVADARDLVGDEHLRARNYFTTLEHPAMGPHLYRGIGFQLSSNNPRRAPGPLLGEHNEYVCKELLGMRDDEVAEAIIDGGITTDGDLPARFDSST